MKYTHTVGFGYDPADCLNHFLVVIPKNNEEDVTVYERYKWDDKAEQTSELPSDKYGVIRCKVSLSRARWNEVKPDLERVLNAELKKEKKSFAHFSVGQTPVEKLLGKEMLVLLWAIESCDKNIIKKDAIRNWEGLCREERWWLYTMTNSATGNFENKCGWRNALRFAITNNPDKSSTRIRLSEKDRELKFKNEEKASGYYGFGYSPAECLQHFMVKIPKARKAEPFYVVVYERFVWDAEDKQFSQLPDGDTNNDIRCKVSISNEKWELVKPAIEDLFNTTLKKTKSKTARFKPGYNPVERLLGKEMMVLLWAIEDCDISVIPTAIRNWQALSREEKWWLFTMTNATTGAIDNKHGWRIALKYALTDNPIDEKKEQLELELSWDDLFKSAN